MKRLFLMLLTVAFISSPYVYAEDDNNGGGNGDGEIPQTPPLTDNPVPVPFEPGDLPNLPPITRPVEEPKPRSLSPISGVYANGVVELCFMADMGAVSVTVISTTTGNMWTAESDSCDGIISINIGHAPGSYIVNIDTQTAGLFVGQFAI